MSEYMGLDAWAARWGVPRGALYELHMITAAEAVPDDIPAMAVTETDVQNLVRLEAGAKGIHLWRNNVGVLRDERGVPVRFGLANDNPKLNAKLKSSDLIGWRPVTIAPHHVGKLIAQFVARECKKPGWTWRGDAHELAQKRFIDEVNLAGGDAAFAAAPGTLAP